MKGYVAVEEAHASKGIVSACAMSIALTLALPVTAHTMELLPARGLHNGS